MRTKIDVDGDTIGVIFPNETDADAFLEFLKATKNPIINQDSHCCNPEDDSFELLFIQDEDETQKEFRKAMVQAVKDFKKSI